MAKQNYDDDGDWIGGILATAALWCWLVLVGVWIVSKWLTEMLFVHVLDPLLDFALSKNDGLVVLLAGLLWTCVFTVLFWLLVVPQLVTQQPDEIRQALLVFMALGLAWGISIGIWLLMSWWSDVDRLQPVYEPAQMLGTPVKIISAPSANGHQALPARQELEADLADIFKELDELQPERVNQK